MITKCINFLCIWKTLSMTLVMIATSLEGHSYMPLNKKIKLLDKCTVKMFLHCSLCVETENQPLVVSLEQVKINFTLQFYIWNLIMDKVCKCLSFFTWTSTEILTKVIPLNDQILIKLIHSHQNRLINTCNSLKFPQLLI
jgi:hypothetical protein